ncbi:hypothetical protein [Desulfococcus multivorans]|jgi:hypothetical protein|uniref:Uncharacterized protein n=2 Tax=Desulfococcus TaxID=896 RepID=S7V2R0_DESML|nr:hypothetical protein [Desulfococcus multivorans]AQV00244.1 hypothetical protein B2D07_05300 [Desulfococcus multivorans]EPR38948.1 hypothetical protein dsmv_0358 [Desulfococcus multivorans DSM 2059]MDX9817572.1 hypothetical protein [Desulfococcus multivorans]SJZ66638.1 hypothetical protein SAMN02745446_01292 [Desulfococcus multivorans DSM 2059]
MYKTALFPTWSRYVKFDVANKNIVGTTVMLMRICSRPTKKWWVIGVLAIGCFGVGCSGLLPSSKRDTKTIWASYDAAKKSFDEIVPYKTTTEDLRRLGYDPFVAANIKVLTYIELLYRFLPNNSITKADLDEGIQDCLLAKDACTGYEVALWRRHEDRFGNVFLDLFSFRRKTKVTGWEFNAFIIMKNGLVVYKNSSGRPNIDELIDEKKPLGPFQDIGGDTLIRNAGL